MRFTIDGGEWSGVLNAAAEYNDEAVINLKERGILIRVQDKSNVGLYNCLIPSDVFGEYNRGEHPRIGVDVEDLKDVAPGSGEDTTVEMDGPKIKTTVGSRSYTSGNIDPDSVSSNPEQVPDIDLPINFTTEPEDFLGFIGDAYSYIYDKSGGKFYLQANNDYLTLWSRRDDYEITEYFNWSDFEDHNIDWSSTSPTDTMEGKPQEEERATSIISTELTSRIKPNADLIRVEFGHGMPLKIVSETEIGIKNSWIIPPIYPKDNDKTQIPENVIKDKADV